MNVLDHSESKYRFEMGKQCVLKDLNSDHI